MLSPTISHQDDASWMRLDTINSPTRPMTPQLPRSLASDDTKERIVQAPLARVGRGIVLS